LKDLRRRPSLSFIDSTKERARHFMTPIHLDSRNGDPAFQSPAGGSRVDLGRPLVTERGASMSVAGANEAAGEAARVILYERLTGEAARRRATSPEPEGAGMTPEQVARVEYVEVWNTLSPSRGYDFRMYSFGGVLLAARSTRK
jgi:hypothetical protein